MITEQELKDQITPEFIKWCCEYAKGFVQYDLDLRFVYDRRVYSIRDALAFSTLLHRAVEGWNEINPGNHIWIEHELVWIKHRIDIYYKFENYQPWSLTRCECAILDCMLFAFNNK